MKKLIFSLILILSFGTAFAGVEKYAIERPDGKINILSYVSGSDKSLNEILSDLHAVKVQKLQDNDSLLLEPVEYLKFGSDGKVYAEDYENDQNYWASKFDSKLALGSLAQVFSPDRTLELSQYLSLLQNLMEFKNFTGLKEAVYGLLSKSIITQDELNTIKSVFMEQRINLDSF